MCKKGFKLGQKDNIMLTCDKQSMVKFGSAIVLKVVLPSNSLAPAPAGWNSGSTPKLNFNYVSVYYSYSNGVYIQNSSF